MAAFITRTMDQSIQAQQSPRRHREVVLPPDPTGITLTTVGDLPQSVEFDGTDFWVANKTWRHRATHSSERRQGAGDLDGRRNVTGLVTARGRIFVTGNPSPGKLYFIDPTQSPGAVTILLNLPTNPIGIAFDGARIWTANIRAVVSIITLNPAQATNVTTGFSVPSASCLMESTSGSPTRGWTACSSWTRAATSFKPSRSALIRCDRFLTASTSGCRTAPATQSL